MNTANTYLAGLLLCFASMFMMSQQVCAQAPPLLGVSATRADDNQEIIKQLPELHPLGIRVVEFRHPVEERHLKAASEAGMQVLVRLDRQFLIPSELAATAQDFTTTVTELVSYYAQSSVSALGLYSFSASYDPSFQSSLSGLLPSLVGNPPQLTLYEVSTQPESALSPLLQIDTVHEILPASNLLYTKKYSSSDLGDIEKLIDLSPHLILFDYQWFSQANQTYPPFAVALQNYAQTGEFLLPLPKETSSTSDFNWLILIFLLIWGTLGIHVHTIPTYKPLIARYFAFHRFFVDDIMRYRLRSAISGIFLLIQHALFGGFLMAMLAREFISPIGLDALFNYFPVLSAFGNTYFSIFLVMVFLTFLIEIIGILWLYLPSKSMKHISQTINLYSWVFHLDFLLVSVLFILHLNQISQTAILLLSGLFVFNWLLAFFLAAIDSSRYLVRGQALYLLLTLGIHTLLFIGMSTLLFGTPSIIEVLELAITI